MSDNLLEDSDYNEDSIDSIDCKENTDLIIYSLLFVPDAEGDIEEDEDDFYSHFYTLYKFTSKSIEVIKAEIINIMKTDEFVKTRDFDESKEQYFMVFNENDPYCYNKNNTNRYCFKIYPNELNTTKHIKSAKKQ